MDLLKDMVLQGLKPDQLGDMLTTVMNPPERLTDWLKEPELSDLKQDFQNARQYQQAHIAKINEWLDNLNVDGKARVKAKKGSSTIQPRLIRKQAEWRYAALSEPFLSTTELFDVSPVSWEDRASARQNALVLNNQFQTKINKVAFIDEYIRTLVDEGTAIVRVGWKFEEGVVKQKVNQYQYVPDPMLMQEYEQMIPQLQANPKLFKAQTPEAVFAGLVMSLQTGQPVRAVYSGTVEQETKKVIKNHPTLEICNIRNVYIDPTCNGVIDDAQFVVHSYETSLSELKKDKRNKNLDRVNLDHASVNYDPEHFYSDGSQSMQFRDKARKKVTVYEYWGYWDIDGSGITKPIVASWVGDTLIRLEENPFPDRKLPFVVVSYLPKRKSIYGEPDGELLIENQKILGAVTRGMIDLLGRSANAQMGMSKQMLDATNRIRFERGENYEFNPQADPRRDVFMHTYPEIPNSAMFMVNMMNTEAESLTGVKAFATGGGISGDALGETAQGVRSALDAASKREVGILRRAGNGIIEIGRKLMAMNADFLNDEEVIRVTNEEFVTVRRDDLAGNFDLKLTISTAESDNAKAQELAFMLQTMGNGMPPQLANKILGEIARLRQMPDLAKEIEEFEPQPDPMQQQMQELQLQLLQAQVMLTQAEAQQAQSKADVNMAKIDVEQARAEVMRSDADNRNLDFVHRSQGEDHLRNLEMEQVKQEAKQGGVTDALLAKQQEMLLKHQLEKDNMQQASALRRNEDISRQAFSNLFQATRPVNK